MMPVEFASLWFIFAGDDASPPAPMPAGKKLRHKAEK